MGTNKTLLVVLAVVIAACSNSDESAYGAPNEDSGKERHEPAGTVEFSLGGTKLVLDQWQAQVREMPGQNPRTLQIGGSAADSSDAINITIAVLGSVDEVAIPGTYNIGSDGNSITVTTQARSYVGAAGTIVIDTYVAGGIAGTFSGRVVAVDDGGVGLDVVDGRFSGKVQVLNTLPQGQGDAGLKE